MPTSSPHLLTPFQLHDFALRNRIVLAPMTRARAGVARMPNAVMAEYYAQRRRRRVAGHRSDDDLRAGERLE